MNELVQFYKAQIKIEACFQGLPHAHTTLIKSLITRADPNTGMVENLSCRDLANLLAVDHAPGRKGAGIPKIETIRSYLRTIAKSCPDDFRLINQGQRIACLFINMPKIYAHFCDQKEVYGDNSDVQESIKPLVNTATLSEEEAFFGGHETGEPPIEMLPEAPVKNINILNNNNNNNYILFSPIADDFVPNPQTIAKAMSLGHSDATDFNVIREFINYNQAIGSQWADYNPVYLVFLAKRVERKKLKQQHTQSGRAYHASSNNGKTREPNVRERVKQAHASQFEFCETSGRYRSKATAASGAHCHAVVATY